MDNCLKRINEESQISENSKTTKLENHLSQLPDDCLLDILPRLDHDDLDQVSILSRNMCILSDLSRAKARNVFAYELRLIQITNEQFYIIVTNNEGVFFVDNSNQYAISERMTPYITRYEKSDGSYERPQTQIISEIVANRIIALVDRFDFGSIIFEGVSIDINIVLCIQKLSASKFLQKFGMRECAVDESLTSEGRTRFLSILLAITPKFLFLWCYSLVIDELFIKEYADSVPFAELILIDYDLEYIETDEKFMGILWKFNKLCVPHMIIDVDWIMPLILKRLHQKMVGSFYFVLTRQLTQDDIEADLPADVQNTCTLSDRGEDIFTIEIVGTTHKAIIRPTPVSFENPVEWKLRVQFM